MKQKAFVKHISRDCRYKFNSAKCSSKKKVNSNKCQYEYEKIVLPKKIIVGIQAHVYLRILGI